MDFETNILKRNTVLCPLSKVSPGDIRRDIVLSTIGGIMATPILTKG